MWSFGKAKVISAVLTAYNNATPEQREAAQAEAVKNGHLHMNEDGILEPRFLIFLIIGIYLLAALLPSAISTLNGANTTGWTATQIAIYGVFSVIVLAVVIIKISE